MHFQTRSALSPNYPTPKSNVRILTLDTLVQDVQKCILQYLEPSDLLHVGMATRSLYMAASDACVCIYVISRALRREYTLAAQRGLKQAIVYDERRAGLVTTSYMKADGDWGKRVVKQILLAHRWNVLERVVRDGCAMYEEDCKGNNWILRNDNGNDIEATESLGGLSPTSYRRRLCLDIQRVVFTRGVSSLYRDCFLAGGNKTSQHGTFDGYTADTTRNQRVAYNARLAYTKGTGYIHRYAGGNVLNRMATGASSVYPSDLRSEQIGPGEQPFSNGSPGIFSEDTLDLLHCGLHTAALKGHTELVRLMVTHAHEWNRTRTSGISLACSKGQSDTMKVLFAIEDPSADENNAMFVASASGCLECVSALLSNEKTDPQAVNGKALQFSSSEGHVDVVRLLLKDGRSDPCAKNSFGLRWASRSGHTETVSELIRDNRADPAAQSSEALRSACVSGYGDVVRLLLLDGRADPRARNCEGFLKAAELGHTEVVKHLLDDGRVDPATDRNKALRLATKFLRDGR
ncbi:hypothetical protein SARC_02013 [Sphaeroforma arctica JP610]|uniref:Uncharacterized protein n=1 Tax=Sphaeroforma arctica JP610 TaxID=667725 RepID=A0A0L0GA00_9EUKA|nr:hypothetical protein SARC_02013 [Sphaeroforma arctica JP610]KNC85830.1 hypothetical protein SARC_02013 [Sphaeroforma arctica JP610]|eukprot:XP_014159732.1 hypothetical protein SARC_02013 [Sphaeroforma arctica JP610]